MSIRSEILAAVLGLVLTAGASSAADPAYRLTLDEAKQLALTNSKLLALAGLNAQSKEFATRAVKADYFPKVIGSSIYFHFDGPLGQVLTPRAPLPAVAVRVLNQDSAINSVIVAQPVTALLKVRQGVKIARADEQIAQAQADKGRRAILDGVEQLYLGLLAAQKIRAGALIGVQGAEQLAKTGTVDAKLALLEAKQGLQAVDAQIAEVASQLTNLLDLPPCSGLELVEPPIPVVPFSCAEDAASAAVACSPEVREAEQDIVKAHAAVKAAKVDFLPNVVIMGGYANQTVASYIQSNVTFGAVQGSWTFYEWGKRKNVLHERELMVSMAQLKVHQTQDDVRLKALKAYREVDQQREAVKMGTEMVELRKEAEKAAAPAAAMAAVKARMLSEVDLVKSGLAYHVACTQLARLTGCEP